MHAIDRSQLPPNFAELPIEEALRVLLRGHLFDVQTLTRLELKHSALVEYIETLRSQADDD